MYLLPGSYSLGDFTLDKNIVLSAPYGTVQINTTGTIFVNGPYDFRWIGDFFYNSTIGPFGTPGIQVSDPFANVHINISNLCVIFQIHNIIPHTSSI